MESWHSRSIVFSWAERSTMRQSEGRQKRLAWGPQAQSQRPKTAASSAVPQFGQRLPSVRNAQRPTVFVQLVQGCANQNVRSWFYHGIMAAWFWRARACFFRNLESKSDIYPRNVKKCQENDWMVPNAWQLDRELTMCFVNLIGCKFGSFEPRLCNFMSCLLPRCKPW
jgi:hypothetical protein